MKNMKNTRINTIDINKLEKKWNEALKKVLKEDKKLLEELAKY